MMVVTRDLSKAAVSTLAHRGIIPVCIERIGCTIAIVRRPNLFLASPEAATKTAVARPSLSRRQCRHR